jgi:hypothetical protein
VARSGQRRAGFCIGAVIASVASVLLLSGQPAVEAQQRVGEESPRVSRQAMFGVVLQNPVADDSQIRRMRRGGVGAVRFIIPWTQIEAVPDTYNWQVADRFMATAERVGAEPLPFISHAPHWLRQRGPLTDEENLEEWREFLRDLVARYGPGGHLSTYYPAYKPIRSWQLWNEPNIPGYTGLPEVSPAAYVDLVHAGAEAIRSVDPGARIIAAGLAPGRRSILAPDFIARVYRIYRDRGLRPDFDEVTVHPYARRLPDVLQRIRSFRKKLRRANRGVDVPIMVGEIGWGSRGGMREFLGGRPRMQARKLKLSFEMLRQKRARLGITRAFWFAWQDLRRGHGCSFCSHAGLLKSNGEPKPAWRAFRRAVRSKR